jgi:hypothetical protein
MIHHICRNHAHLEEGEAGEELVLLDFDNMPED